MLFTMIFWRAALERAIKSAGQFAVAAFGADRFSLVDLDALGVLYAAGAGFVLSVLTSVASSYVGDDGPSLTSAETLTGEQ